MLHEAEFLRRSIRMLNRYFEKRIQEKAEQNGFTLPQMWVIRGVLAHPGIGIRRLARDLQMTQSTASDVVSRLIDKGVLIKRTSHRDKRAVEIWPAVEVEMFMENDRNAFVNRPAADLLDRLQPDERLRVLDALGLLMSRLNTEEGDGQ